MSFASRLSRPDPSLPLRGRPQKGKTARVWEIADKLYKEYDRIPDKDDVVRLYMVEMKGEGNEGTAKKQYYDWLREKRALDESKTAAYHAKSERTLIEWLSVATDGSVWVPPHFLQAVSGESTGVLQARVVDGIIQLVPQVRAVAELRALVRSFDKGEGSVVEELIRERRIEADKE